MDCLELNTSTFSFSSLSRQSKALRGKQELDNRIQATFRKKNVNKAMSQRVEGFL